MALFWLVIHRLRCFDDIGRRRGLTDSADVRESTDVDE
jgi:hypothetical protein